LSEPRNVEDVQCILSADLEQKPMREVLRDRATRHARQPKALREKAFRVRAGMQALLLSCLCCYPLVKAETESEHEEWCPAHRQWLSAREVERRYGDGRSSSP
jgi:hypothetical protein